MKEPVASKFQGLKLPSRSLNLNAHCERFIRSLRDECLRLEVVLKTAFTGPRRAPVMTLLADAKASSHRTIEAQHGWMGFTPYGIRQKLKTSIARHSSGWTILPSKAR